MGDHKISIKLFHESYYQKALILDIELGDWQNAEDHLCRKAALKTYEQAGVNPADISVAEVHDASAFAEIVQIENLGFCELGQGGWLAERGETSIGGRIPVNPSGGLESKGHPIGATGLAQIYELVHQTSVFGTSLPSNSVLAISKT